ncbi:hypothetical protein ES703_77542 [subsurface metagenome]
MWGDEVRIGQVERSADPDVGTGPLGSRRYDARGNIVFTETSRAGLPNRIVVAGPIPILAGLRGCVAPCLGRLLGGGEHGFDNRWRVVEFYIGGGHLPGIQLEKLPVVGHQPV